MNSRRPQGQVPAHTLPASIVPPQHADVDMSLARIAKTCCVTAAARAYRSRKFSWSTDEQLDGVEVKCDCGNWLAYYCGQFMVNSGERTGKVMHEIDW